MNRLPLILFSSTRVYGRVVATAPAGLGVALGLRRARCRLDTVFDEFFPSEPPQRIFLKLDTQGWDLHVLAGLGSVDAAIVGAQSEMSILPIYDGMPDFRTSLDSFGTAGFEIAAMFAVSRDQFQRLVEFDCVMLRVSALARRERVDGCERERGGRQDLVSGRA